MTRQLSLSEIDALARKATRGAGYSWGLAEDAGKSVRWLSSYGLAGCEALAALIQKVDRHVEAYKPRYINEDWVSDSGFLCPIYGGALINDQSYLLLDGKSQGLNHLLQPLLALPQAARIAEISDFNIRIQLGEIAVLCSRVGMQIMGEIANLPEQARLNCEGTDQPLGDDMLQPSPMSRVVSDDAFEVLNKMAHKTYAPATEASRLAGAGAGLSDND